MPAHTFTHTSTVPASPEQVWARVVTAAGINDEMWPIMTMRLPRSSGVDSIEDIEVGERVGRAWLRLFGVFPFEYDDLMVAELDPGRRFLETSTMFSMRRWEHERTLSADAAGCRLSDRVTFEPRLAVPGLAPLLTRVLAAFFAHRHRRLIRHFGRPDQRLRAAEQG